MARFFGKVGFGHMIENPPGSGIWKDGVIERKMAGDLVRTTQRREDSGEKVNRDLSVSHSVSVVGDAYANENLSAIRYVKWAGALWNVNEISFEPPRLVLRLGGVYDGPVPEVSEDATP